MNNDASLYRTLKLKPMIKQSHLKSFHRRSESQSLHSNKIISPIQSQKHIAILPATLKRKVIKRNMTSDINIIRENVVFKPNEINLTERINNKQDTVSRNGSSSRQYSDIKYANLITPRSKQKPVKSQMLNRQKFNTK